MENIRVKTCLDYKMGRRGVGACKKKKILFNIHLKSADYLTILTSMKMPLLTSRTSKGIKYPCPERSSRWSKKLPVKMMMIVMMIINFKSRVQSQTRTRSSIVHVIHVLLYIYSTFLNKHKNFFIEHRKMYYKIWKNRTASRIKTDWCVLGSDCTHDFF